MGEAQLVEVLVDLGHAARGDRLRRRSTGRVVVEQHRDLVERQPGDATEADDHEPHDDRGVVAALGADPLGWLDEPAPLVEAQARLGDRRRRRQLTDRQASVSLRHRGDGSRGS
jgi:hypothetical protein